MSRISRLFAVFVIALSVVAFAFASSSAQSAIEELATQQIANETGIDENDLATLFVDDDGERFIIAFVYINEAVLQSDLRQDLKDASAPFVGRNAMLTLVVPRSKVKFNPTEIAFVQNNITHLLAINQVHAVNPDFLAGELPANKVTTGILLLPPSLDFEAQFDIVFRGEFETPFFVGHQVVVEEAEQEEQEQPGFFLLGILQFLLSILLLPFLIFV